MDLAVASSFFDNDPLYDGYTGTYLYDGQFATYDGSQLDGSFIRRRTVSLSPELVLPARRVVSLFGEKWVLSDPIVDGFQGTPVRQTMSARKCHDLYTVATATELLKGTSARQVYGFSRWTKGTADFATSDLQPYFEFSFSTSEAGMFGKFIVGTRGIWHARMATESSEGFLIIEADQIFDAAEGADPSVTVTIPGELDPIELTELAGVDCPGLLVERYSFFRKLDEAQPNNQAGDKTLVISKADMPEPPLNVTIASGVWSVIGKQELEDAWALHVRKV